MGRASFECVGSSEIDSHARLIYKKNFGETPKGDIKKLDSNDFPDFNVLCAGFPCQSFSICGQREGFNDKLEEHYFLIFVAY
jgi:DNA (cytosine-5)-methyltransferase 1